MSATLHRWQGAVPSMRDMSVFLWRVGGRHAVANADVLRQEHASRKKRRSETRAVSSIAREPLPVLRTTHQLVLKHWMNVLVYNGSGVSASSRDHAVASLRSFLAHRYDVQLVTPKALKSAPWQDSCALLVFPGGRDLPYVFDLQGEANTKIRNWVAAGGRYLGFCAGAYYASQRVEFELGTQLEVQGDRALSFFPGVCRGTAFPGFAYESESGARQVSLELNRAAFRDTWQQSPSHVDVWYNGGGAFELPDWDARRDVQVLGRYADKQDRPVAGVRVQVGNGKAILWSVHPEHPSMYEVLPNVDATESARHHEDKERARRAVLRATLSMLDLDVSEEPSPPPRLLPITLSSSRPEQMTMVRESLQRVTSSEDAILRDRHDTFHIQPDSSYVPLSLAALHKPGAEDSEQLRTAPKNVCVFASAPPSSTLTPLFNHESYFSHLVSAGIRFMGATLLYGEVVTSTQTMLDKNDRFLSALPTGTIFIASHQVAGRGRGGNSWVSPAGCLQFSMVLRLSVSHASKIVFLQYLFGVAVVEAVRARSGYENIDLALKWPNDIYGRVGAELRKVGGILVNSSYQNEEFTLVVGCGINLSNSKPTTSVNELIALHNASTGSNLDPLAPEDLLASISAKVETYWPRFTQDGFEPFLDLYLSRWLHGGQRVQIESTKQLVQIVGITTDHGMLRTVPVETDRFGESSVSYATFIDLQPDGNSFDMLQGLLKAKS
ncbi:biotin holocarboxylase synthetase [Microbotryomycetes sp. JL201]|nr:biotin holocarboxylase synthetase [Microbotryomycetes sp. JL201]